MKKTNLTLHALLTFATLLPSSGFASTNELQNESTEAINLENLKMKTLGFDPRNAINTLEALSEAGVKEFYQDGTFDLSVEKIETVKKHSFLEGIDLRVMAVSDDHSMVKLKLKQLHLMQSILNQKEVERLQNVSKALKMMCDMAHPTGGG